MEPEIKNSKISAEERKRLDRQRFIGLETQQKLLNSLVLITPANGPNTQLAKNLVLSGVNVAIFDNAEVTDYDIETNFLIAYDQLQKKRAEVIYLRLKDMNPSGKNQYHITNISQQVTPQFLERFTVICTSFTDMKLVQQWDTLTRKVNKPYYNIVCCGFYAFTYISLGMNYTYKEPLSKKSPLCYTIPSLSFQQSLAFALEQLKDKKKVQKKQYDMLQGILMISEAKKVGLAFNAYEPSMSNQDMLFCAVELGENLRDNVERNFLVQFARLYGVDYCPVYSVIGSIVSQEIIKVVENQQQPAINWLVFNSEEGYACVLKLKEQDRRKKSFII